MSNGIAVMILLYMIRQGHYFLNGFPFFLWMFYYVYVENVKLRNATQEAQQPELEQGAISASPSAQAQIE